MLLMHFHLNEHLLALILHTHNMHFPHTLQLPQHVFDIHHWRQLHQHHLRMFQKFILPLHNVRFTILHRIDTTPIPCPSCRIQIDDIHRWNRQFSSIATPHFHLWMQGISQDFEVMSCHFTKMLVLLRIYRSVHSLRHIPKVHTHASSHITKPTHALGGILFSDRPCHDIMLIPCRQFRTALLCRHSSTHDEFLILIPFRQLLFQSFPRLNLLHSKRYINPLIASSC